MKYMMFVVVDPDAAAEAEPSEDDLTIEQWLAEVDGRGKRITGDALRPVSDATTVRVSRGQVLVTDGPFTESKESQATGTWPRTASRTQSREPSCTGPTRECHDHRRPG
jgi:hypothetical protein